MTDFKFQPDDVITTKYGAMPRHVFRVLKTEQECTRSPSQQVLQEDFLYYVQDMQAPHRPIDVLDRDFVELSYIRIGRYVQENSFAEIVSTDKEKIDALSDRVRELLRENVKLQEIYNHEYNRGETLQETLDTRNDEYQRQYTLLQDARRERERLEKELASMRSAGALRDKLLDQRTVELEGCAADRGALRGQMKLAESNAEWLAMELQSTKAQLEMSQRREKELNSELKELKSKYVMVEARLSTALAREAELRELTATAPMKRDAYESLQQQFEVLKKDFEAWQKKYFEAADQCHRNTISAGEAKQKIAQLEGRISILCDANNKLDLDCVKSVKRVAHLEDRCELLQNSLREEIQKRQNAESDLFKQKAELGALRDDRNATEKARNALASEITNVRSFLQGTTEELNRVRSLLRALTSETNSEHRREYAALHAAQRYLGDRDD